VVDRDAFPLTRRTPLSVVLRTKSHV
jgi:hypothetical protein